MILFFDELLPSLALDFQSLAVPSSLFRTLNCDHLCSCSRCACFDLPFDILNPLELLLVLICFLQSACDGDAGSNVSALGIELLLAEVGDVVEHLFDLV